MELRDGVFVHLRLGLPRHRYVHVEVKARFELVRDMD